MVYYITSIIYYYTIILDTISDTHSVTSLLSNTQKCPNIRQDMVGTGMFVM